MPIFLGKYIANPNKNCIRRHYSFIGIRYVAPTIINTFLESHDFAGKKVIMFATSGGSKFGKTVEELKVSVPASCQIVEGRLLNGKQTIPTIREWTESLDI